MSVSTFEDRPNRIIGHGLVLFVLWFLVALYGVFNAFVRPENMPVLGTLGDWFGVFNPILGFATVLATLLNLHYLTAQIRDQKVLADDQKRHDLENLLREKLEETLVAARKYTRVCYDFPQSATNADLVWYEKNVNDRDGLFGVVEMLGNLYFPNLKPFIKEMDKLDTDLSDFGFEIATEPSSKSKIEMVEQFIEKAAKIEDSYLRLLSHVIENMDSVITGSPMISKLLLVKI